MSFGECFVSPHPLRRDCHAEPVLSIMRFFAAPSLHSGIRLIAMTHPLSLRGVQATKQSQGECSGTLGQLQNPGIEAQHSPLTQDTTRAILGPIHSGCADMKNISSLVAGTAVVLTLLAIPLMGCEAEVSLTTASLSEATITTAVDDNMQPLDATNVFAPDTPTIWCSVKLSFAPPDTEVKAQWLYIGGEATELTNSVLYEDVGTESGSYYLGFSLSPPASGWPRGNYMVKFYIDGKEELSVPFTVQDGTAPPAATGKASLQNIFQEEGFGYTIRYPGDWLYEASGFTVIFSGKEGTAAYYSTITIQNLASTQMEGGIYENVDSAIGDFKQQLTATGKNIKVYNEKAFVYAMGGGEELTGKQYIVEFVHQGENLKRLRIVVPRSGGNLFYAWAYTSSIDQYDAYLGVAEAMLDSWVITE